MVFSSSFSSFLDPPINWPQSENSINHPNHSNQLQENGSLITSHHRVLSHHFPQNPNPNQHHVNTAATIVDQASLNGQVAERARQAKNSHPPEGGALKCPRCDSTNTKFCYFNNYNLTQPRHFCKACRRYWTRGGALRNVPVGGGCRRNKKSKSGNSKSKQSTSTVNAPSPATTSTTVQLQGTSQFPFLPTLQNLTQLGGIGLNLAAINGNTSSSFLNDLGFLHGANTSNPVMVNNNNNENNIMTSLGLSSHFALFDRTMGLYNFPNEGNTGLSSIGATRVSQTAPVKIKDHNLSTISRPVSGLMSQSNQYWTGIGLPGSSSNDHHQHLM